MKRFIVLLVLLLFGSAWGKTWYLDKYATGANNGTSKKDAWTSISSVPANVSLGDTILVYKGEYQFSALAFTHTNGTNYDETIYFIAMEDSVVFSNTADPGFDLTNFYEILQFDGINFKVTSYVFSSGASAANGKVKIYNAYIDGSGGALAYRMYQIELYNTLIKSSTSVLNFLRNPRYIKMENVSVIDPGDYFFSSGYNYGLELWNCAFYASTNVTNFIGTSYTTANSGGYLYFTNTIDTTGLMITNEVYKADFNMSVSGNFPHWIYIIDRDSPLLRNGKDDIDIGCLFYFSIMAR